MIKRCLQIPQNAHVFLFGPRQTGKSTFVRALLAPQDLYLNLLQQRVYLQYEKDPGRFHGEVLAHRRKHGPFTCIIDEVQRIPSLLDDVHDLIESTDVRFLLTGSSARKLRRGGANLLAGRAYTYHLYPLTISELGQDFALERALRVGMLPVLWGEQSTSAEWEFLRSYTETYLKEEIQEEGLIRRVGPFTRFLDVAAANDGQVVNFSAVARDCGVTVKTAQEYYTILEDTFLAHRLMPWYKSTRKRLVGHPKFFFFDPGVTNVLAGNVGPALNPVERGRRFEQLGVLQVLALVDYGRMALKSYHYRTTAGAEVDLLLVRGEQPVCAIEFKSREKVAPSDYHGLRSFLEEHPEVPGFVVTPSGRPRAADGSIQIMGLEVFLAELPTIAAVPASSSPPA